MNDRRPTRSGARRARLPARLVLADGAVFEGEAMGALEPGRCASGELVFNTCLSGYQEVITDPSYAGQVLTFTYPHIGNYGVSPEDEESRRPFCRGVIVRDLVDRPSNWRAAESLESFLRRHRVPGLTGVDTRRLTRHVREAGADAVRLRDGLGRRAARGRPGRARHGGRRPGVGGDHRKGLLGRLKGRPTPLLSGRLRLRDQKDDPSQPHPNRGRRGRPCHDVGPSSARRATPTESSCPTVPGTLPL